MATPDDNSPGQNNPVENTPGENTLGDDTPGHVTPGDEISGDWTSGDDTSGDDTPEFKEVPPSRAPQLVPWTENSTFLSPGGAVAGISAFAESATSPGRSRGTKLFIRVVVTLVLISLLAGSVWRIGRGFL